MRRRRHFFFASCLAYVKGPELTDFYNMSAVANSYTQAAAELKGTFENWFEMDGKPLAFACFAWHDDPPRWRQ